MLHWPFRRATIFVVVLGFLVQITGINAVIYFTPLIFTTMGLSGHVALLSVPAGIQFVALLATLVAIALVDRIGRRKVLLSGIATMIVANALLAVGFATDLSGGASVAFVGVLLFTCGFDFGFGAMVWVSPSEPTRCSPDDRLAGLAPLPWCSSCIRNAGRARKRAEPDGASCRGGPPPVPEVSHDPHTSLAGLEHPGGIVDHV